MKTLEETILDNALYEAIKKHLLYHIQIQENIDDPLHNLNESLGSLNSVGEIAEAVFDELKDNGFRENIEIDCKKFKTYFDKLSIECKESKEMFATYNGQDNREISITLNIPSIITYKEYDEFMFIMIHELMHGYEDKRRTKHGKPSIFALLDDNYKKSVKLMFSFSKIRKNIGVCEYLLNDQEMNAYFGTLDNVISSIIKKEGITKDNIKYDLLIDKIKSSHIFEDYFKLCKFIVSLNNIDENDKEKITILYNDYFGKHMSFNDIVKSLNKKWDKFYSKFNQLVPKIICKHLVNNKKTYDITKL